MRLPERRRLANGGCEARSPRHLWPGAFHGSDRLVLFAAGKGDATPTATPACRHLGGFAGRTVPAHEAGRRLADDRRRGPSSCPSSRRPRKRLLLWHVADTSMRWGVDRERWRPSSRWGSAAAGDGEGARDLACAGGHDYRASENPGAQLLQESSLSPADYHVLPALSEADGRRLRSSQLAASIDWERSRLSITSDGWSGVV
jgi:hypothetical protein